MVNPVIIGSRSWLGYLVIGPFDEKVVLRDTIVSLNQAYSKPLNISEFCIENINM